MKTRAYVHSSNVVSARALEKVDLKRVISAAVSIATLIWHDLEPNMHAGQAISRAHGKSNSLFPVKFCYILRACLTKKSVIYVQNTSPERSGYNDVAPRLFTLKRCQYCRFQNTFQLAFFPSLLSTCRSRLLFASLRERRKFGVDRRITINMEVNLCHSVVPQACNVILQCMHIYKVILSHSNGSSSARRLELDGRLHNY